MYGLVVLGSNPATKLRVSRTTGRRRRLATAKLWTLVSTVVLTSREDVVERADLLRLMARGLTHKLRASVSRQP